MYIYQAEPGLDLAASETRQMGNQLSSITMAI